MGGKKKIVTCKHCGGSTRCSCNHCSKSSALGVKVICKACRGKGSYMISEDAKSCAHCGGSTWCRSCCGDGLGGAARCHVCKGKGYA